MLTSPPLPCITVFCCSWRPEYSAYNDAYCGTSTYTTQFTGDCISMRIGSQNVYGYASCSDDGSDYDVQICALAGCPASSCQSVRGGLQPLGGCGSDVLGFGQSAKMICTKEVLWPFYVVIIVPVVAVIIITAVVAYCCCCKRKAAKATAASGPMVLGAASASSASSTPMPPAPGSAAAAVGGGMMMDNPLNKGQPAMTMYPSLPPAANTGGPIFNPAGAASAAGLMMMMPPQPVMAAPTAIGAPPPPATTMFVQKPVVYLRCTDGKVVWYTHPATGESLWELPLGASCSVPGAAGSDPLAPRV